MAKKLETDSILNDADLDGDGIITDAELNRHERMISIENADKKQDAMRNMAWFALGGMLLYPFAVVVAILIGVPEAAKILGSMAPTYFVSVAGIVTAFYVSTVYSKPKT